MASQKTSNWRPKAVKKESLHVEEVGGEVLVYDLEGHRVHCLNDPAVRIWKLCNGRRTVKEIASELEGNLKPVAREMVVRNAIGQFASLGLVDASGGVRTMVSRRDMARKIGIGAAAAVALPLITSILAPPASAASSLGHICTKNSDCSSGCCCQNASHRNTCQQNALACGGQGCM